MYNLYPVIIPPGILIFGKVFHDKAIYVIVQPDSTLDRVVIVAGMAIKEI
jgi:hypothetical protein